MLCLITALGFINIFFVSSCNGQLMIDQLRSDFLNLEERTWQYVLEQSKYGFNDTDDPGIVLIKVFDDFDSKLQEMPQDILYGMEVVRQTPPFLFLFSDLRVINDMYDKFRRFLLTSSANDNSIISVVDQREDKISYIIEEVLYDPKNNVNKIVTNIFEHVFGHSENGNIISSLFDITTKNDYLCNHKQSQQQVFYNLYNTIALADLKGYIMTQFSYMARRMEEKGNYTVASIETTKQFQNRTTGAILTLGNTMNVLLGTLWKCDPKQHIKGSTYEELTALLQGHIENEVDMNQKGTCRDNCAAYPLAESYGCYDRKSAYCTRRRTCNGKIIGCRFIESHMKACFSPSFSSRRYEYIEYKSGKTLGKKHRCQYGDINSWFRWFVHCSYCLCLCDQEGIHSDRYFNLRPVMADVNQNRVVTGLRIIKHNRIIHLQIQEGKLLPYGYIDSSTIRWVPVDDYKITDEGVEKGIDFHIMNYEHRTMFLDNLMAHEPDHIITGVRFEFIDGHLKFEINVRQFEFATGIISNNSYYIYGHGSRQKININDPDIPTTSPPSAPHFEPDTFVQFTHTSFDKDAAQTTVPFFDAQPVTSEPPLPLRAAGIYYKGKNGYGGFIAPKLTVYDFKDYMKVDFPKIRTREDVQMKIDEFPNLA